MFYRIIFIFISVVLFSCNDSEKKLPKTITFSDHIAPILTKNCITCHNPKGIAPFSLLNYKQVFRKKKTIADVVKSGYMPPWPADATYTHFINERVLSQYEKKLIVAWVETGAKEGKSNIDLTSQLINYTYPKPDLIVKLPNTNISANQSDMFFVLKSEIQIPKDTFVSYIAFLPSKNSPVHHLNGHLLNFDSKRKSNIHNGINSINLSSQNYNDLFYKMNILHDDGSLPQKVHSAINYLPGVFYLPYPNGIGGFPIHSKSALIANDIHFGPSHLDLKDSSEYYIYYSKSKPQRPTQELMLGTNGQSKIVPPLLIKANTISIHKTKAVIPEDISILTINPHMHLLGKSFLAYAITPNLDTIRLIKIKQWDFNWQYFYTFPKMLKIPKGSTIYVLGEFDNTKNNPNNPYSPPQTISDKTNSMKATDEMFQFIITWVPYQNGDENISLQAEK